MYKRQVYYPSFEEIRAEDLEGKASLIWQIYDASGSEIRRMKSAPKKGIQRQVWNLRTNTTDPIGSKGSGFLVTPGDYTVSISLVKDGSVELLVDKQAFKIKGLNNQTLLAENPEELKEFRAEMSELNRKVSGTEKVMGETKESIELIEKALLNYPNTDLTLLKSIREMMVSLKDLEVSGNTLGFHAEINILLLSGLVFIVSINSDIWSMLSLFQFLH